MTSTDGSQKVRVDIAGTEDAVKESGTIVKSAKVVLPTAPLSDDEDDEDDDANGDQGPAESTDFLADWPDETEYLEIINSRISALGELHLPRFGHHLKRLCLRQNAIKTLEDVDFHNLINLEDLDLYDNQIKHIGTAFDKLENLCTLDLSFNLLKHIPECLEHLPALKTVYFVQNKILHIAGLDMCTKLMSLELGGNRLRRIENLESLVNLEQLWLGKNKIPKLENLQALTKLRVLSIQSNRITKIEGLEALVNLEELYLSHNGIKVLEGLENNVKLTTLDVASNFVSSIENISHLTELQEFWMNGNQIPDLRALDSQLKPIPSLETVYLEGNPCQSNDRTGYRRKIMLALPQVKQIDATYVRT